MDLSTITFLFNESPTVIKNFNTLNYDGDAGWLCDSIITGSGGTSNPQSGTVTQFIEKEGSEEAVKIIQYYEKLFIDIIKVKNKDSDISNSSLALDPRQLLNY